MWIASKYGWFSIVRKEDGFHVRARDKADLEELLQAWDGATEIETWPGADYRYRVRLTDPGLLADLLEVLGNSIDYPNFKSMIRASESQKAKLGAYHEIWATMAREQR